MKVAVGKRAWRACSVAAKLAVDMPPTAAMAAETAAAPADWGMITTTAMRIVCAVCRRRAATCCCAAEAAESVQPEVGFAAASAAPGSDAADPVALPAVAPTADHALLTTPAVHACVAFVPAGTPAIVTCTLTDVLLPVGGEADGDTAALCVGEAVTDGDAATLGEVDDDAVVLGVEDEAAVALGDTDGDAATLGDCEVDSVALGETVGDAATLGEADDDAVLLAMEDDVAVALGDTGEGVTLAEIDEEAVSDAATLGEPDDDAVMLGVDEDMAVALGDSEGDAARLGDSDTDGEVLGEMGDAVTLGVTDDEKVRVDDLVFENVTRTDFDGVALGDTDGVGDGMPPTNHEAAAAVTVLGTTIETTFDCESETYMEPVLSTAMPLSDLKDALFPRPGKHDVPLTTPVPTSDFTADGLLMLDTFTVRTTP